MNMIGFLFALLCGLAGVQATHFRFGLINWSVPDPLVSAVARFVAAGFSRASRTGAHKPFAHVARVCNHTISLQPYLLRLLALFVLTFWRGCDLDGARARVCGLTGC
jgi:hypothetical protein